MKVDLTRNSEFVLSPAFRRHFSKFRVELFTAFCRLKAGLKTLKLTFGLFIVAQTAIESSFADAEHRGSAFAIALGKTQNSENVTAFEVAEFDDHSVFGEKIQFVSAE